MTENYTQLGQFALQNRQKVLAILKNPLNRDFFIQKLEFLKRSSNQVIVADVTIDDLLQKMEEGLQSQQRWEMIVKSKPSLYLMVMKDIADAMIATEKIFGEAQEHLKFIEFLRKSQKEMAVNILGPNNRVLTYLFQAPTNANYFEFKPKTFFGTSFGALKSTKIDYGWKMHFSFDDAISHRKGCQILCDYALKQGYHIKFWPSNVGANPGRNAVLYLVNYDNKIIENVDEIATELDDLFTKAKIKPGPIPELDLACPVVDKATKTLKLSQFTFYRNELDAKGSYIEQKLAQTYNDAGVPDPFKQVLEKQGIDYNPPRIDRANLEELSRRAAFTEQTAIQEVIESRDLQKAGTSSAEKPARVLENFHDEMAKQVNKNYKIFRSLRMHYHKAVMGTVRYFQLSHGFLLKHLPTLYGVATLKSLSWLGRVLSSAKFNAALFVFEGSSLPDYSNARVYHIYQSVFEQGLRCRLTNIYKKLFLLMDMEKESATYLDIDQFPDPFLDLDNLMQYLQFHDVKAEYMYVCSHHALYRDLVCQVTKDFYKSCKEMAKILNQNQKLGRFFSSALEKAMQIGYRFDERQLTDHLNNIDNLLSFTGQTVEEKYKIFVTAGKMMVTLKSAYEICFDDYLIREIGVPAFKPETISVDTVNSDDHTLQKFYRQMQKLHELGKEIISLEEPYTYYMQLFHQINKVMWNYIKKQNLQQYIKATPIEEVQVKFLGKQLFGRENHQRLKDFDRSYQDYKARLGLFIAYLKKHKEEIYEKTALKRANSRQVPLEAFPYAFPLEDKSLFDLWDGNHPAKKYTTSK